MNIVGKITIGVGIKTHLKLKGYKFDSNNWLNIDKPGAHGLYMIGSNKCKYNHSDK